MALTLQDLTVNISNLDRASLLGEWRWLIGTTKLPVLVTAIGNAFVVDTASGSVHMLDVGPGTLHQVATSLDEFRARLRDKEFVIEHFVPFIVARMRANGHTLQAGHVYGFKTPPPLGGEYSADNLQPTEIVSHFSVLGGLHEHTIDVPGPVFPEITVVVETD
ncbi:MAG: T6SS immunity protein Tdi1 domain-containing protein [Gammaproteobacteria bacterium]